MLKKIAGIFYLPMALLLFAFQGAVISCTKTDTIQEQDTLLTTAILTANPWRLLEERTSNGGIGYYYLRGGTNNTADYTNEYITFNSTNTGTYTANDGTQFSLTWNFTDATDKKIVFVLNYSTPVTITWENILYDDGQIRYTEYYVQNGTYLLSEGIRIPK